MANPLYDRLFGAHAGKTTPFYVLDETKPSDEERLA